MVAQGLVSEHTDRSASNLIVWFSANTNFHGHDNKDYLTQNFILSNYPPYSQDTQ